MGQTTFDPTGKQQAKQKRKQRERILIVAAAIVAGIRLGVGASVLIIRDGGCGAPFYHCDLVDNADEDGGL